MFGPPAQLREYRPGPRDSVGIATNHAKQLPFQRRHYCAANRTFDKGATRGVNLGGQFLCGFWQHGAHLDDQGIAEIARQQPVGAFVDGM